MKCVSCDKEIKADPITGWDSGNNGLPLFNGSVCDECNKLVLLMRIKMLQPKVDTTREFFKSLRKRQEKMGELEKARSKT